MDTMELSPTEALRRLQKVIGHLMLPHLEGEEGEVEDIRLAVAELDRAFRRPPWKEVQESLSEIRRLFRDARQKEPSELTWKWKKELADWVLEVHSNLIDVLETAAREGD
jgi:hypothetical protein